jgi:Leucine-rich repeat (LRR) protein
LEYHTFVDMVELRKNDHERVTPLLIRELRDQEPYFSPAQYETYQQLMKRQYLKVVADDFITSAKRNPLISAIAENISEMIDVIRRTKAITSQISTPALSPTDLRGTIDPAVNRLILGGVAPPETWRNKIEELYFDGEKSLVDLAPLENLTYLKHLELSNTNVVDLSPLANLHKLRTLDLAATRVSDITPLASLNELEFLDLEETQVSDLSPVTGMVNMRNLVLTDTQVKDLTPLRGLKKLQRLALDGAEAVLDISPLCELSSLEHLNLEDLYISDVSALSNLKTLRNIDLWNTKVADVSALAGLDNLDWIELGNTLVSDLSPLAHLFHLHWLGIEGSTLVTDISPLRRLWGLKIEGFSRSNRRRIKF